MQIKSSLVALHDFDGHFICHQRIPRTGLLPEVIMFGTRIFIIDEANHRCSNACGGIVRQFLRKYRETTFWIQQ